MVAKGSGEPGDGRTNLFSECKTCVVLQRKSNMFGEIAVTGAVTCSDVTPKEQ